jgi:6-phosphofructokinase 1
MNVLNGDLLDQRASGLRNALEARLGAPGKWEMLFCEGGTLIQGVAERLGGEPTFPNPTLADAAKPRSAFVPYDASIPAVHDWDVLEVFRMHGCLDLCPRFLLAGERTHYVLDPTAVKVGVLIAGGPAAGLNMVVDSIVKRHFSLATQTVGSRGRHELKIVAYVGGYLGLGKGQKVLLAPSASSLRTATYAPGDTAWFTDEWATEAGVRIKALRQKAENDPEERASLAKTHAQQIEADQLDILYVVGGNGTLSWASEVVRAWKRLEKPVPRRLAVVGGPKTMDNDVNFTDVTFGFRTAVDNAADFIRTIHTSAESINRLGVIELFGAASGFVALHAGYVSGVADYVMIPEPPSPTEEEIMDYLERRMQKNGHAVIVVAEGALEEFRHGNTEAKEEAFTNFLRRLRQRFKAVADVRARYLMRDTPPNSFDLDLCKWSGKLMVDTALAGFTECSVQLWQGDYVLVPFETAVGRLKQVVPWSYYLQTLRDRERLVLLTPS